jgi:NAD(P)-dependent dehydrogenase (short-subunit alcohol dehydrogenase family)
MASYLITGCSRGIGLEAVKLLSASSTISSVFATARKLSPALQEVIESSNGRVQFVTLDVSRDESVSAAVQEVTARLGAGKGLDVLVNNAGIKILDESGVANMHGLSESLEANVVSVQRVSAAFLPLLSLGAQKKMVMLSSDLGCIGTAGVFATNAPFPSYKISKAAVNMLTVQIALELGPKGFIVFVINPGWLRTDLGGPYAPLDPIEGARQVVDIIEKATPADNGVFRSIHVEGNDYYDGKNLSW